MIPDNEMIKYLARELLLEIERQGYSVNSHGIMGQVSINIFPHSDEMTVENISQNWTVRCGKYKSEAMEEMK